MVSRHEVSDLASTQVALAAARRCAVELSVVAASVVYRGRQAARRASREALTAELAVAAEQGAAVPSMNYVGGENEDWRAAALAGKTYATRWLQCAVAEIQDAEAQRSNQGS